MYGMIWPMGIGGKERVPLRGQSWTGVTAWRMNFLGSCAADPVVQEEGCADEGLGQARD